MANRTNAAKLKVDPGEESVLCGEATHPLAEEAIGGTAMLHWLRARPLGWCLRTHLVVMRRGCSHGSLAVEPKTNEARADGNGCFPPARCNGMRRL